jgi:hypothetical protein
MATIVRVPWQYYYNYRMYAYNSIGAHKIIMIEVPDDNKSTYIFAENDRKIDEFAITVSDIFNGSFAAACSLIIKEYDEYYTSYDSIIDQDLMIDSKDGNVGKTIKSFDYFNSDYSENEKKSLIELKREVAEYIRTIKGKNIDALNFLGGMKNVFSSYVEDKYLVDDFTRSKMPYFRLINKVKEYLDD